MLFLSKKKKKERKDVEEEKCRRRKKQVERRRKRKRVFQRSEVRWWGRVWVREIIKKSEKVLF